MNITILGAAGFIGTNLAIALSKDPGNNLVAVDSNPDYFDRFPPRGAPNVSLRISTLSEDAAFDDIVEGQDLIYDLVSTTSPTTSNRDIARELHANIKFAANLFDACVRRDVGKVLFVSSGGTVYGKDVTCPISEDAPTNPITAYGLHKLAVEKLLHLYNYMYGLDYGIARLSNPYGPYQRPNGMLGAVTTFVYKALNHERIEVYGDGSVTRDFIYIDDAIEGLRTIAEHQTAHRVYNIGCGRGTSVRDVLNAIQATLDVDLDVAYTANRKNDVPVNYLDMRRFEAEFGSLDPIGLAEGIKKTADFMMRCYDIG